jgi:dephospho-CoA kinase
VLCKVVSLFSLNFEEQEIRGRETGSSEDSVSECLLDDSLTLHSEKSQRLIALTGGIGSGKTQVSDYLETKNIPVADADKLVHHMLQEDDALLALIRAEFGDSVFNSKGILDRTRLGALVFQDPIARKRLEGWTHPRVREGLLAFRREHPKANILVEVIPLLFESGLESQYPEVWLVETPEAEALKRLQEKRGMSEANAWARLNSQLSLSAKKKRLSQHPNGCLLSNTSELSALFQQVDTLILTGKSRG